MDIPEGIFKSYDIRGIYPDEINEGNIIPITRAVIRLIQKKNPQKENLRLVLGRDMRLSSPVLFEACKKTLLEEGVDVLVPGLVSTPTFYFILVHYQFDGGIQITASHNPKQYNGLKIVINSPSGLVKVGKNTGMDEIKKNSKLKSKNLKVKVGKITTKKNIVEEEVKNASRIAGDPKIGKFKVVADPANSMGALYLEELFKQIPGELVKMNFELDGTFPVHQPDPLQFETLKDLQKKVVLEKADLGLAPDGDGDRIFFIDEKGQIVPPSIITAIIAKELLTKNPKEKMLFDIRYILTPKKIIEEAGGESIVTKVGHAFITEDMQKHKGLFAGESSGHYYFRATGGAESAVTAILIVLAVLTEEQMPFSEIVKKFQKSRESGEINFKVSNASEIIEVLKGEFSDGELNELDGIAVDYPNWRFSVRTSNTEPLLRLNVEEDIVAFKGRHNHLVELIQKHAKV